ncbi:DUF2076 domain-containing protein [Azospirillum sp. RWY-5-1]|uniref:DUF2076 domain-containing protein n=1 Tax=Azospirillum oleiclasticum TaxID=2735135 RepID=A0ABX2TBX0_9PROT|nr:DUF2076 domain-containing protein [Azospirillum oleiclasticum]NYZ16905.1 DUF2076 domain-containing protein [Azospirillum oleiclasticum]NYZ21842.1 DUF2076 domain-containing protein [Azospirillum oleiclasticum]
MDPTERQIIDELFGKLRQAEAQSGPRDPQAEAYIRDQVARQPAAPYIMAQSIVMMEQGLATLQARVEELERQQRERPAAGGGGLFGSLFGGGRPAAPAPAPQRTGMGASPWGQQPQAPAHGDPRVAAYANPHQPRPGGGFMAGAMQTAVGVAGGMLLGSALASAFAGDEAAAQEPPAEEPQAEPSAWDEGGFGEDEEL